MAIDQSLLGCILSEQYAEESDRRMSESGLQVDFRVAQSQFHGRWEQLKQSGVTGIFLWPFYQKFKPLKPHHQRRGTCVARGAHRALMMSYFACLAQKVAVGKPIEIAWEPIYAGSRVYSGKGQISGDGSCGPWAAEWLAGINGVGGFCERKVYGSANLTTDSENWSVANADRGDRLPPELLAECQLHTCASNRLRNNGDIADAISSYFGVFRCWDTLFGNRDSSGMATANSTGAHCQAVIGVFVTEDGEDGFVELQSWGDNMPSGPRVLKYKGGQIELPPGCYGVRGRHYTQAQKKSRWWDAHAVAVRAGEEYR